ncbi:GDSL esterase/lipase EXL3-like [Cornus florida]|uniref:GDSL esterase/lipase EXL3-like n=1 Tax=Cornus florida TaxID=4283 RepID=UPI002896C415|nr:GDSL esterase/lipase EXL3-like [Cornus florida]
MHVLHLKFSPFSSSSITLLCVFLLINITQALTKIPHNESIPAVFMFGDSIVDTGNNNNIQTIAKANFRPYGKDLAIVGGKPTGRFSNGKVPADLFAEELGIKMLLPAYLDPNLQTEDLPTGVNFAAGAAGYDPLTSELSTVISLSQQLDLFKEYIEKLERVVGNERSSTILASSLYGVVAGSNDITNTYFLTPFRRSQYDFPSYANLMVNSASNFMQDLYKMGARRIAVLGLPPCGCLPSQRSLFGGEQRQCVEKYNEAAQLFNSKLSEQLKSLDSKLPDSKIVYIDIYSPLLDLIQNPNTYGFEIADTGCCGTGRIEVTYLCSISMPCTDVSKYLFWDSFHPTEKAYRLLVHQLLNKYLDNFF